MDYEHGDCTLNGRDLTAAICVKDDSFRHEDEVRAIIIPDDASAPGTRVVVDLSALIDLVVIGPRAPGPARTVIEQLLRHYGVLRPVAVSQFTAAV